MTEGALLHRTREQAHDDHRELSRSCFAIRAQGWGGAVEPIKHILSKVSAEGGDPEQSRERR